MSSSRLLATSNQLAHDVFTLNKKFGIVHVWTEPASYMYQVNGDSVAVENPGALWINGLECEKVLAEGGLVVQCDLWDEDGSEIDFTIEFKNGGYVLNKSVNASNRLSNDFQMLEHELEGVVREWVAHSI